MTHSSRFRKDTTKYLIYGAIALLLINFILMFLPFLKIYQPSYKETVLGVTTYKRWYTQWASMVMFIVPAFLTGIPYLCSIISVIISLKKKNKKSIFFKVANNAIVKPVKFFWLKFGAVANGVMMWVVYSIAQGNVKSLEKHGAYCHITFFGVMNILCTVAFIVLLFVLSGKTKSMFTLVNKANSVAAEAQQDNNIETEENEQ